MNKYKLSIHLLYFFSSISFAFLIAHIHQAWDTIAVINVAAVRHAAAKINPLLPVGTVVTAVFSDGTIQKFRKTNMRISTNWVATSAPTKPNEDNEDPK